MTSAPAANAPDDGLASARRGLPHPALRASVTGYHGYRYAGGPGGVHHGLPSTSLTVVLSFDQPLDVGWLGCPGSQRRVWTVASGLTLSPAAIHHDGRQHGIQLDLTPWGARLLLGVPSAELHRGLVDVEDLVGAAAASRLYEEVSMPRTWAGRFAALDAALLRLASANDGRKTLDLTVRHAWSRLHATTGQLAVSRLAADVGWSRGQLARRFRSEFGIGPKQVARLVRFDASRELVTRRSRLADVAAQCGYADQAHLTREWRELAGLAPRSWLAEEGTNLQDDNRVP